MGAWVSRKEEVYNNEKEKVVDDFNVLTSNLPICILDDSIDSQFTDRNNIGKDSD